MKHIYFTAGPSQLYPTVPKHLETALQEEILSMSHRGEAFQHLFSEVHANLKRLLTIPKEHYIFFISSANEAWEKILENCVARHSFHFINGAFSGKCFEFATLLKKEPEAFKAPFGQGFDFNETIIPPHTELVCLTHNESSSGVSIDIKRIHSLKKAVNTLFALDVVSSIPYVNIDYSLIDCVYFSVQKGFGLPAGMGVLILSPKAMEKSLFLQKKGYNIGSYHNFLMLKKFADKNQTPETPNVLSIFLLNEVVKDMLAVGIKTIRKETDRKAQLLYAHFDTHKKYTPVVKNKQDRSATVVAVESRGETDEIVTRLKKKNIIVGKGYGEYKKDHIRIANFPAHSLEDVKKLLAII